MLLVPSSRKVWADLFAFPWERSKADCEAYCCAYKACYIFQHATIGLIYNFYGCTSTKGIDTFHIALQLYTRFRICYFCTLCNACLKEVLRLDILLSYKVMIIPNIIILWTFKPDHFFYHNNTTLN